jgi:hypothetical protein
VQLAAETMSRGTQVHEAGLVKAVSRGTQVQEGFAACSTGSSAPTEFEEEEWENTAHKLDTVACNIGLPTDHRCLLSTFINSCKVSLEPSGSDIPEVHRSTKSWSRHYSALSFLLNGHLHTEYEKLSGMLGLPSCSHTTWHKIVKKLEEHVSSLAEWSFSHVRDTIKERGDQKKWIASFDGFYLTRGHHSNNSSATLHDYMTGWFCHRTKRGEGHNWEGTSGGAEGHMFEEIMKEMKQAGFFISEVITDKDSAMNAIYSKYFPEGTITYCANHCAKTMHKDLLQIKQVKCEVSITMYIVQ